MSVKINPIIKQPVNSLTVYDLLISNRCNYKEGPATIVSSTQMIVELRVLVVVGGRHHMPFIQSKVRRRYTKQL
jgi:hypothetical protein